MEALWKEMEAQLKPLEGFVKGFETRKAAGSMDGDEKGFALFLICRFPFGRRKSHITSSIR